LGDLIRIFGGGKMGSVGGGKYEWERKRGSAGNGCTCESRGSISRAAAS